MSAKEVYMDTNTSALITAIAAAFQAIATVVLVGVTWRYVTLIRRISITSERNLKTLAHSSLLNRLDTIK